MNILIVDDHAVVRQGYSALLTMMLPDAVVSEAENAQQTLKALAAADIDLVILDINLENASGLNLAGRLLKRWPRLKIIFFSMFDEPSGVNRAIQTGAKGYLSKRSKPEVMVEAIKAVLNGKRYIEHNIAIQLATHQLNDADDSCKQLTQREFDVFLGIAKGLDRAQLADELNVSSKTVSNTLTQLKAKLQISTHAELVHLAIEQGYLKVAV